MVEISWLQFAIDDLNEIAACIAKDSPRFADLTTDKIFERTAILRQFPESGRIVPEIGSEHIVSR